MGAHAFELSAREEKAGRQAADLCDSRPCEVSQSYLVKPCLKTKTNKTELTWKENECSNKHVTRVTPASCLS